MRPRPPLLRLLESIAIPNITLYLVVGQLAVLGLALAGRLNAEVLVLVPAKVLAGEWHRLFSFVLIPPPIGGGAMGLVFAAFAWYLFWLMGSALEEHWGAPRYNLFLLAGWAFTVAASFASPAWPTTNLFIGLSVFLAFARIVPDFELLLFFILPVKVKWIALVTWIGLLASAALDTWNVRFAVLASVGNFLIFFGRDLWLTVRHHKRRIGRDVQRMTTRDEPRHRCHICGKDSNTHPDLDFRYCSKCAGDLCYCAEHIHNHEHVAVEPAAE